MNLTNYYIRSAIYPSIILFPVMLVTAWIDNKDYESEWLTGESVIGMTIIMILIYGAIMSLLTLTLFLNRYHTIRSNSLLSALAWFLLPGSFIAIVLTKSFVEFQTVGSDEEIKFTLIVNLPFILALIWNFIKFRSQVSTQKNIPGS